MLNLARRYYVFFSVVRDANVRETRRGICSVNEPVDSPHSILHLKENLAKACGCDVKALTAFVWFPLGAAAEPGDYRYAVTSLVASAKPVVETDYFSGTLPLDSVQGMEIFLNQMPQHAPLFIQPLRPTASETGVNFIKLEFSKN